MALVFYCLLPLASLAQTHRVIIEGDNGQRLKGVLVLFGKESVYEISDVNGIVELPVPANVKDTLFTFSHLGFKTVRYSFDEIIEMESLVVMKSVSHELEGVEVIGRRDEEEQELVAQIATLDMRELNLVSAQTPADALENSGQVFVQRSQMGGGSPVIRGFEANRVLLVVDGVRMNNAIYRGGHLQNSISIDKGSLAGMEVIFGPGALTYGSDALGGVVHFRTKNPRLNLKDTSTLIQTRITTEASTVNKAKSISAGLNLGRKHWAVLSSASYVDYSHLLSGKRGIKGYAPILRKQYIKRINGKDSIVENTNPYLQIPSGYKQYALSQKWKFRWSDRWDLLANIQYTTTSDIPRYDQLTATKNNHLKYAEWYYGPQTRLLTSLQFRWHDSNKWFDKALIIGARQMIGEDRFSRKLNHPERKVSLVDVKVWSLTMDFEKELNANHVLLYGADCANNEVSSTAYSENILDLHRTYDTPSRYPDGGSGMSSAGFYTNYRWQNRAGTGIMNIGFRYAYSELSARFSSTSPIRWPDSYYRGTKTSNQAIIGTAGWRQSFSPGLGYRLVLSTAYRTPNVDDFAKIREKNGFITVPNSDLRPERSINGEVGINWEPGIARGDRIKCGAALFYARLRDGIVRQNFHLPNGDNYFVSYGDTLMVQANVNSDRASIYGVTSFYYWQWNRWHFQSHLSYTRGRRSYRQYNNQGVEVFSTEVPQAHIPPVYGMLSLGFEARRFSYLFMAKYSGAKKVEDYAVTHFEQVGDKWIPNRTGTSDNIEDGWQDADGNYRGTPARMTANLYINWTLSSKWKLTFSIENITDLHYRNFASGISAPGRNWGVSLQRM